MAKYRIVRWYDYENDPYYELQKWFLFRWWGIRRSIYIDILERYIQKALYRPSPGEIIKEYGT